MAEERYQATEKVTQKMTRDGLVTKKGKPPEEIPENPGLKKRHRWSPGGIFRLVPGISAEKDPTFFRAASGIPRDAESCSFCFFGKVRQEAEVAAGSEGFDYGNSNVRNFGKQDRNLRSAEARATE